MQVNNNELINELQAIVDKATTAVTGYKQLSAKQLNFRTTNDSWSVLECIEHLNLYGDFYLPEIQREMAHARPAGKSGIFKSGWIGNYFANLMLAKNGKVKKMKTFEDKNPLRAELSVTTIDRFLKQQELLKSLLQQARGIDLTGTKTSISISKAIKLRLGDTFRFLIYHIERHVKQADNVLAGQQ